LAWYGIFKTLLQKPMIGVLKQLEAGRKAEAVAL
jgi:hypothetical protein